MPEISIIVPVYRVEAYLKECIDSILNQTFIDFEVILIDDGSPDRCGEICEEYAKRDERISVIHQQNKGLSGARNTGIEKAKGSLITFIDSDDIVLPQFLERMRTAFVRNRADIVACNTVQFEKTMANSNCLQFSEECVMSGKEAALLQYSGLDGLSVIACGKLYSKNLFEKIRFPEGKIHEDEAIIPILLYRADRVVTIKEALYGYRKRQDSIINQKFSVRRYDAVEAARNCAVFFRRHKEMALYNAATKHMRTFIAIYALLASKEGISDQVPKRYRIANYRAIVYLRKSIPHKRYMYWVGQYNPKIVLIEEYLQKVKSIFGKNI